MTPNSLPIRKNSCFNIVAPSSTRDKGDKTVPKDMRSENDISIKAVIWGLVFKFSSSCMQSDGTWKVWRVLMTAVMAADPTTQPCRSQGSACTWWWPALSLSCHDGRWLCLGQFGRRGTGTERHSLRVCRNFEEHCNARVTFLTKQQLCFLSSPFSQKNRNN